MNYIGGKYKLLPQLFPLFPEEVNTFVDLFAGGGDIFINVNAKKIIANDLNNYIIDIYKTFQQKPFKEIIIEIESRIQQWGLNAQNEDAYKAFRTHYNETHDSLDLYILICHSFNYQFRFNSDHQYNNPFGRNRSWFNPTLRKNLIQFLQRLENIELHCQNFKCFNLDTLQPKDFVYADPPYLITTGSYNDGKRGFEGWGETEETMLYEKLDLLNEQGIKFALSNVIEHKGLRNEILDRWRQPYTTHYLLKDYNNSSYNSKNKDKITSEVLITNY